MKRFKGKVAGYVLLLTTLPERLTNGLSRLAAGGPHRLNKVYPAEPGIFSAGHQQCLFQCLPALFTTVY